MRSVAFLSRLLLALCLVVTTTAGAVESLRMHMTMANATAAPAQSEPPCHGEDMAMDGMARHAAASQQDPAPFPGAPMDCCQAGHCDGICLLSLPPLPARFALAESAPRPPMPVLEPSRAHPAPSLARPQRPPIFA